MEYIIITLLVINLIVGIISIFKNINESYITERLGKYKAIGPVILGLKKPINDLSRGAKTPDVESLSYITALQVVAK